MMEAEDYFFSDVMFMQDPEDEDDISLRWRLFQEQIFAFKQNRKF